MSKKLLYIYRNKVYKLVPRFPEAITGLKLWKQIGDFAVSSGWKYLSNKQVLSFWLKENIMLLKIG